MGIWYGTAAPQLREGTTYYFWETLLLAPHSHESESNRLCTIFVSFVQQMQRRGRDEWIILYLSQLFTHTYDTTFPLSVSIRSIRMLYATSLNQRFCLHVSFQVRLNQPKPDAHQGEFAKESINGTSRIKGIDLFQFQVSNLEQRFPMEKKQLEHLNLQRHPKTH